MYFDHNATALLDPRIKNVIETALTQFIGNPSSPHSLGQLAKSELSEARRHIAAYLKVKQSQIIFTSGGTEGACLCLKSLIKDEKPHIITSTIEHACVHETLELFLKKNAEITYLPVGLNGAINLDDLQTAIRPNTSLIVIMAANNETGVKQDLLAISALAEKHRIPFITDGVSYLGKEKFQIHPGIEAMFFSGHKIHALQGSGFVYLKNPGRLNPQIYGGGQEFGLRGGTENMLGIIALSAAIQILAKEDEKAIQHMLSLRDFFEKELLKLPNIKVNGSGERICNTTNISFGNFDGESLLIALDQAGIKASLGSACSSGAIEPSRILLNMGISLVEARSSIRFSFSRLNTMEEIKQAILIIKTIYES